MYSVAVTKPGQVELVDVPALEPGPYDVVIKTEISFVCNLTDRKVIDGHMPGLGLENYPLLLGHETVGRVSEIGKSVANYSVGQRVVGGLILDPPGDTYGSGWGGHSEYTVIKDHPAMTADVTCLDHSTCRSVVKSMLLFGTHDANTTPPLRASAGCARIDHRAYWKKYRECDSQPSVTLWSCSIPLAGRVERRGTRALTTPGGCAR